MIRFVRHIFFDDFWLKLFSLALALLIWLVVSFASEKEGIKERVFAAVPVQIVSTASDVRSFQPVPERVEVTVKGEGKVIDNLQQKDVRARVDLTGMEAARNQRQPVEVAVPDGVTFVRAAPREVQVTSGLKLLDETKPE
jgi:hypothetical protein